MEEEDACEGSREKTQGSQEGRGAEEEQARDFERRSGRKKGGGKPERCQHAGSLTVMEGFQPEAEMCDE